MFAKQTNRERVEISFGTPIEVIYYRWID